MRLGSRFRDRKTGTFGDLATLSFYPPHHMTTGEGGAVLCRSVNLLGVLNLDIAKNMGMTIYQFIYQIVNYITNIKITCFGTNLSVKNNVKKNIAQLFF